MPHKTDNGSKNDPELSKTDAGRERRLSTPLLDRIDELQDFYDFSPVTYLSLNDKGQVLRVNLTGAVMMKVVRSELNGRDPAGYSEMMRDSRT